MVSQPAHFAVFGDPVAHSLSPRLFHWLFAELAIRASYEKARVPSDELARAVERVRSGDLQGASVTLPLKEKICALVDELDVISSEMAACNCIVRLAGRRVRGHNTDVQGVRLALAHRGVSMARADVLVLGAGGAGRAAAFAAAPEAKTLFLANRTPERASRLASDLVSAGRAVRLEERSSEPLSHRCEVAAIPLTGSALQPILDQVSVVMNATRVGLSDPSADPLPQACQLSRRHCVLDMVYQPLDTALLTRATRAGAIAVDGLWMLLYQAFEQLKLWTGHTVESDLAERSHDYLCRIAG